MAVRNRQRLRHVNTRLLRDIVKTLVEELLAVEDYDLGVCLVGTPEITRLNQTYLRHAGPTDVIAFDYTEPASGSPRLGILPKEAVEGPRGRFGVRWQAKRDTALAGAALDAPASPSPHNEPSSPAAATLHGELFICVPEAVAQARRFRVPWQTELLRYVLHGLLHLRGLDDSRPAARRRMKQAEDRCLRQLARRFRLAALGRNQRTSPQ